MQCRSIKTIFSVLVVFAVFALITGCEAQDSSGFQGKAPPEIKAEEWINSEPLSLASLTGKIVVVEFWATWCPPCRQSIPHLIELSKQFKDKNVVIVSLTKEDMATVKPFSEKMGMTYPVGVLSNSSDDYGVKGIPNAFIIGKDGKVLWQGHPMAGLDKELEKATQP